MKARSCPSPLDAISIIIFKRCPILRTHLANLLAACWSRQYFPKVWRRATVTLIHKKGDTSDPQNFRPIALQPVMGKIFSSCIRNRLWDFLISNSLIDTSMQKGFWPGINGVTEHIELLSYLLSHQKKIQKRYLCSAFGSKKCVWGSSSLPHSFLSGASSCSNWHDQPNYVPIYQLHLERVSRQEYFEFRPCPGSEGGPARGPPITTPV